MNDEHVFTVCPFCGSDEIYFEQYEGDDWNGGWLGFFCCRPMQHYGEGGSFDEAMLLVPSEENSDSGNYRSDPVPF